MEYMIDACSTTLGILGKPKPSDLKLRLIKYCVSLQIKEGYLLYNLLTREMLLLSADEYSKALSSDYLREHWFTVPDNLDERELVELVRWVRTSLCKKPKFITNYTILTTTDCNARCFYCYERGCARVTMNQETAHKVADFIQNQCGGNKVKLNWFGGEPLMNVTAIDQICEELRLKEIDFESNMISNAYLFDDEIVAKASGSWRLKQVQVTLDGTEENYNRSKAFVYRDGSAYQIVMSNILRMLDAGISVAIRLNMDLNNANNLMDLVKELVTRFAGRKRLTVYAHLLFDTGKTWNERYTQEEWTRLYSALHRLEDFLASHGLGRSRSYGLRREIPMSRCMADSGNSVVIVPDGHLGLCEHYTDSEFVGHINSPEWDQAMVSSWRERSDPIAECADCFYFPECFHLKKCTGRMECFEHARKAIRHDVEQAMLNEYRRWCALGKKSQCKSEE